MNERTNERKHDTIIVVVVADIFRVIQVMHTAVIMFVKDGACPHHCDANNDDCMFTFFASSI